MMEGRLVGFEYMRAVVCVFGNMLEYQNMHNTMMPTDAPIFSSSKADHHLLACGVCMLAQRACTLFLCLLISALLEAGC